MAQEKGLEPDECYLIGKRLADGAAPEIALEVVRTAPLLDKLPVYAALGVAEVWVFREGAFTLRALDVATATYHAIASSRLLPELDFQVLAGFATREDTGQALRDFEATLQAK